MTKKQEMAKKKEKGYISTNKVDKSYFDFNRWRNIFLVVSIFQIKNIEIVGNQKLTNEEIISLSQVQKR